VAGAIFVVAGSPTEQQGPVASLLSTSGWAAAAERLLGRSWVVTPAGVLSPVEARRRGSDASLRSRATPPAHRRVPAPVKTAVKDLRQWRHQGGFRVDPVGPWRGTEVAFVWQRHELFQQAGLKLARALRVPSVLFVPATVVWEAEQWGTRRPGWGGLLERVGEKPALCAADLVACGTATVAEQVRRLGTPPERVITTPSGVDLEGFDNVPDPAPLRRALGLEGRFVVGWVGSFRRFHALDQVVEAVAAVDGAALLLVGDGPERPRIEALARARGVPTTCTGTVAHDRLPEHLWAMDVAVVAAPADSPFHYSPLKLAEYLAAGLAVVAPAAGQLPERLRDGVDALLVAPHDPAALAGALARLRDDPVLRKRLGEAGRATARAAWSWDEQVRRVVEALGATA
jgi:glycosyltransferase involved in cell wall biosynthesis